MSVGLNITGSNKSDLFQVAFLFLRGICVTDLLDLQIGAIHFIRPGIPNEPEGILNLKLDGDFIRHDYVLILVKNREFVLGKVNDKSDRLIQWQMSG
jgi:hypothetical protein